MLPATEPLLKPLPSCKTPPEIVVPPVYVLEPVRTCVPVALIKAPAGADRRRSRWAAPGLIEVQGQAAAADWLARRYCRCPKLAKVYSGRWWRRSGRPRPHCP